MLKNLHCHFNNSFQFPWYCRHWAFKVIDILCVVERQKIERKWSQHKYLVSHGSRSTLLCVFLSFRNCPTTPLCFLPTFQFLHASSPASSVPQYLSKVFSFPNVPLRQILKLYIPLRFLTFPSIPQLLLMFVYFACQELESVPLLCFIKPGLCRNLHFLTNSGYFTNYLAYYYFHIYCFKKYLPKDF